MTQGDLARQPPVTAEAASAVVETGDLASKDVHDHLAPSPVAALPAVPEGPVDGVVVDLVPLADVADHHVFLAAGDGLLGATPVQRAIKRLVEIAIASVALVVLSPVFACVAVAILVTSRGPVIHGQQRIGLNGRAFRFAKFRTMSRDAEGMRAGLQDSNEVAGPVFKLRDDPRTTPLGRFLRKYSLDELPQLVHVISGTMALVGPRPPAPRRGRRLRPVGAAAAPGQARRDLHLAGQRALRPRLRHVGGHGHRLHPPLVAAAGFRHPGPDTRGGTVRSRRLLGSRPRRGHPLMKILQVHNRYRDPGGEDSVVAAEADLLRGAGHDVFQYQVENPVGRVAAAGALALAPWNPVGDQAVGRLRRRCPPRRGPRPQHVVLAEPFGPAWTRSGGDPGGDDPAQPPAGVRQRRPVPGRPTLRAVRRNPSLARGPSPLLPGLLRRLGGGGDHDHPEPGGAHVEPPRRPLPRPDPVRRRALRRRRAPRRPHRGEAQLRRRPRPANPAAFQFGHGPLRGPPVRTKGHQRADRRLGGGGSGPARAGRRRRRPAPRRAGAAGRARRFGWSAPCSTPPCSP